MQKLRSHQTYNCPHNWKYSINNSVYQTPCIANQAQVDPQTYYKITFGYDVQFTSGVLRRGRVIAQTLSSKEPQLLLNSDTTHCEKYRSVK